MESLCILSLLELIFHNQINHLKRSWNDKAVNLETHFENESENHLMFMNMTLSSWKDTNLEPERDELTRVAQSQKYLRDDHHPQPERFCTYQEATPPPVLPGAATSWPVNLPADKPMSASSLSTSIPPGLVPPVLFFVQACLALRRIFLRSTLDHQAPSRHWLPARRFDQSFHHLSTLALSFPHCDACLHRLLFESHVSTPAARDLSSVPISSPSSSFVFPW